MNDFNDRLNRHVDDVSPDLLSPFGEVVARRDRRRRRRRALAASGTAMVAVAAVAIGAQFAGPDGRRSGGVTTSDPSPTEIGRPELTYEWNDQPSPVVLRLDDRDVELDPWTYCWSGPPERDGTSSGMCSDGMPGKPSDLDDVGSPPTVDFWFGVEGWNFSATFTELGADCPRQFTVDAERTDDQTFRLEPMGPAGRYQVDLFGRGGANVADGPNGDVSTSFVWSTPVDGPIEQPASYLALVTDDDTGYTSYGVELGVSDLAFQPEESTATVIVTSADGRSATFTPRRERGGNGDCYAEGSLFFSDRDMDAVAAQVAALGEGPFDYRVLLTIDGHHYVGSAVWPRDEKGDEAPNTVLTFEPPLPAYTGD